MGEDQRESPGRRGLRGAGGVGGRCDGADVGEVDAEPAVFAVVAMSAAFAAATMPAAFAAATMSAAFAAIAMSADSDAEARDPRQPASAARPVEPVGPVGDQLPQIADVGTERPAGVLGRVGEPGPAQALPQVVEGGGRGARGERLGVRSEASGMGKILSTGAREGRGGEPVRGRCGRASGKWWWRADATANEASFRASGPSDSKRPPPRTLPARGRPPSWSARVCQPVEGPRTRGRSGGSTGADRPGGSTRADQPTSINQVDRPADRPAWLHPSQIHRRQGP